MPRTQVRGNQVDDGTIEAVDLATDSVITEKIKDKNVTCEKLADDLCERFLSNAAPIGRTRITADVPAGDEFTIPGGLSYVSTTFVERVAIYRNGQLLFNGDSAPVDEKDPVEVYPGAQDTTIIFAFTLLRGDTIQVVTL